LNKKNGREKLIGFINDFLFPAFQLGYIFLIAFVVLVGIFAQIIVMIGIARKERKSRIKTFFLSSEWLLEATLSRKYKEDKDLYRWINILRICFVLAILLMIIGSIILKW